MKLKELAALLTVFRLEGDENTEITGIQMDSRKVSPGDLFVCLPGIAGHMHDSHPYAEDAVKRGASAVVVERDVEVDAAKLFVNNSRYALAVLTTHFYGCPSKEMKVIGITGTNGKTTSSLLVEGILRDVGRRTGLMGSLGMKINGQWQEYEGKTNTQETVDLQRNFRKMREANTDYCVMEVTSIGLEYGRVLGTEFRTALFTNLTVDHLDFHQTMDNYRAAKGLLFSRLGNGYGMRPEDRKFAVVNADDPASGYLAKQTAAEVITYGINNPADVRATNVQLTSKGISFVAETFAGTEQIEMKLVGKFNVYNALGAIAVCLAENVPLREIKHSLMNIESLEGRMEVVDEGQPYLVVVDYAHTPDGLDNALSTLREVTRGKLICVFGCGGDRDRTKRPQMGKISTIYSDYVIVTSDNPRSEDPQAILQEIEPGVKDGGFASGQYELIADRRQAIDKAVEMASPEDVVLIAGKGHETYQILRDRTIHFDDREVAREAI
ncbi:MAG: UDP-N-acetylmuramoylalanyl-D-glutamate--2,6-diaminopimelate ligase, partial [Paenibacillaceae bacterium]|nr:UDP-N-acetylmuramoylalanyl-D-glutamate--2,6-diaminopimelate ligase [Paenibacillaceae bacterium]